MDLSWTIVRIYKIVVLKQQTGSQSVKLSRLGKKIASVYQVQLFSSVNKYARIVKFNDIEIQTKDIFSVTINFNKSIITHK